MVTKPDSLVLAIKDGFYWGLAPATPIVVVGAVILLSRATVSSTGYFEAVIGMSK